MTKFQEKLIAEGYCDKRGAGFCATATKLPRGERGIVALCVKENVLGIYDIDIRNNVGERLYEIQLSKISKLSFCTVPLFGSMKITYAGKMYAFTNFTRVKPILQVIEAESKKKLPN